MPMIAWLRPKVIELSDTRVEIAVPLNRRSKNHLKSMYFGALAAGADLAAGITAVNEMRKTGKKFSFAFKNLNANFLKRAEAQTHFICESPGEVAELVKTAISSKKRESLDISVKAFTPSLLEDEPVADFRLCLSLKVKGQ